MEAFNKTILTALKRPLHSAREKWVDELPGVLWAYRKTSWKLARVSKFALTYGMEAIILTEIGMPTPATEILGKTNTEVITKDLYMATNPREAIFICIATYNKG